MKDQNIKKYQQKELNLMFKTDEKTRNYFYFSAVRRNAQQKPRKLNMQTRLVIDFGGQIETKYNRISILVI